MHERSYDEQGDKILVVVGGMTKVGVPANEMMINNVGDEDELNDCGDDDVVNYSEQMDDAGVMDDEKKSHFEKGGRCKTYQIMGKNLVIPSLKWRKDKSGIYKL